MGLGICFGGVVVVGYCGDAGWGWVCVSVVLWWWVAVAALGGAGFMFRWCCGGVMAALGGVVVVFATVIPNSSERTRQHRSCGLHEVKNFTILPLSYITQKLKTPIWCFWFSSLSLNPN